MILLRKISRMRTLGHLCFNWRVLRSVCVGIVCVSFAYSISAGAQSANDTDVAPSQGQTKFNVPPVATEPVQPSAGELTRETQVRDTAAADGEDIAQSPAEPATHPTDAPLDTPPEVTKISENDPATDSSEADQLAADTDATPDNGASTDAENFSEVPASDDGAEHDAVALDADQSSDDDMSNDLMLEMGLADLLNTPVEVWTATKTKTTVNEAPAVITVVTQADIQRYGYQSVAEILNHVSGFYVVDDHILPNLGIRGVAGGMFNESGNIKVLIDGVNVSFRSTGGNWLGPELVPLSMVKRIEIIRGPASALYGADAFLGIVNIFTCAGESLDGAKSIASVSFDTLENRGVNFDFAGGGVRKNVELLLAGRINRESRNGLALPNSSPAPGVAVYHRGVDSHGMDQESDTVYARIGFNISNHVHLKLFATGAQIVRGGEFSTWSHMTNGIDSDGRQRGTVVALRKGVTGVNLSFTPDDDLSINYNVSYHMGSPGDDDRIEVGSDAYYIRRDFGYKALETNLELNWQVHEDFGTIAAVEFSADWENLPSSLRVLRSTIGDVSAGDVMESSSTRQGNASLYNVGALTQAIWSGLAPYLSLTGGLRFDNHNLYGNQLSGRAGIISNPIRIIHIKLLYGSAFKAPSPLLLYGVPHDVGDIIGNRDLKPQKVHTLEARFTLKPNKYVSADTGVSYSLLKDKAAFVQRGINRVADNISKMKSVSWESELAFMYNDWIRSNLGFEYQWTSQEASSTDSVYQSYLMAGKNEVYPQYIARGAISGQLPFIPLQLSTLLMYVGPRPASAMNALENVGTYELPAYFKLDVTLSTNAFQFLEGRDTIISVTGKNLLNQQVADPGFAGIDYPRLPLIVFAQLEQRF